MRGRLNMTRSVVPLVVLSFALAGTGHAQIADSSIQVGAHLTKTQATQLLRRAHTPDEYRLLAGYYSKQEKDYQLQASDEKQEWIRRSQSVMVAAAKYPRPVDSARYLYEYYAYKEAEAGQLAKKFGVLAAPEPPGKKM
jgi:hypothetical protein